MYQITRHNEIVGRIKGKLALIRERKHKREHKLKCCLELDITEQTLQNYLNCKNVNLSVALRIIDWFEPLEEVDLSTAKLKDIL